MTSKILVAVDLQDTDLTDKLLRTAGEIAGLHQAEVSLVHVDAELPPEVAMQLPEGFAERKAGEVTERLDGLAANLELPSGKAHAAVRFGTIYQEILAEAEAGGADLIVVGCHKPDVADFLLGSNAARVARHATCSVYVVR